MLPLAAFLVTIGTASALLLSGMSFTGNVFVMQGSQPEVTEYTWDIAIYSDSNDTQVFYFDNTDGPQDYAFYLDDSGIASATPGNCTYESGKDLRFYMNTSAYNQEPLNGNDPLFTMQSGDNWITLTTEPHPNRCGLTGVVALNAEIV